MYSGSLGEFHFLWHQTCAVFHCGHRSEGDSPPSSSVVPVGAWGTHNLALKARREFGEGDLDVSIQASGKAS